MKVQKQFKNIYILKHIMNMHIGKNLQIVTNIFAKNLSKEFTKKCHKKKKGYTFKFSKEIKNSKSQLLFKLLNLNYCLQLLQLLFIKKQL